MALIDNPKTGSEGVETLTVKAKTDEPQQRREYSRENVRSTNPHYRRNDNKGKFVREKNTLYFKEKSLEIQNIINARLDANPELKKDLKFLVSVSKMMELGFHIGLPASMWNPKMKPYIYDKKGRKYIIDLFQTLVGLNKAFDFLQQKSKAGKKFLFVSSKGELMKRTIKEQAKRSGNYYINQRWLGGTLTNFKTISESTKKLTELVIEKKFGQIEKYTKKEQVAKNKQIEKLNKFFGGIRTMNALPDAIIVTNPIEEKNAILEAKKLNIPVIAICNTNADPDNITIPIPANNYSVKVVALITIILADAVAAGQNQPLQYVGQKEPKFDIDFKNKY